MKQTAFLQNQTAERLYAAVKDLPIVDYHCHLSPKEIYEDRPFSNIGEIWLAGDHYKWRLMRTAGIDERYITGKDTTWEEKFLKYAEAVEFAAGHPLYHWSHMELMQYFGIDMPLCAASAKTVWEKANAYIAQTGMSPRKLIAQSNVEIICTTDDIIDDLAWHEKIAADTTFTTKVLPSFRTDNVMLVRRDGYVDYVKTLSAVSGVEVVDLATLKAAIEKRLQFFVEHGCRCSDVGIPLFPDRIGTDAEADEAYRAVLAGQAITDEQYSALIGNLYVFVNGLYKAHDMVSQWHLAVVRNANSVLAGALGADCGVDCVGNTVDGNALIRMLDAINVKTGLPQVVIYSLNEANIAQIACITAAFPRVRAGAAWWFCDHKRGIEDEIKTISENASLGSFYGMLTDSRSFLSYARHDYFRQILCNLIGQWIEAGEYDEAPAATLVSKISYHNIKEALA